MTSLHITELRNALLESEQRFTATFEHAPVGIAHVAPNGQWLFVNRKLCEIVGYTRHELLERTFQAITHPDDLQADLAYVDQMLRGAIETYAMEKRYLRKDGTIVWVNLTASLVREPSGAPRYFISVIEDISARRRAETALRFLDRVTTLLTTSLNYEHTLHQIADLAVPEMADWCTIDLLDDVDRVGHVATADADHAGCRTVSEHPDLVRAQRQVLDQRQPVLISRLGDAAATDQKRANRATAPRRPQSLMVLPMIARDRLLGTLTLVACDGRCYADDDLPYAQDLAGRAALAVDNARLYQQAQAAIADREAFVSIAAHELKNPLTSLLGQAQLLQRHDNRDKKLPDRDRQGLVSIIRQAKRLDAMLTDLLDLSRIESGQMTIDREPLDLMALIDKVIGEMRESITSHTLQLHSTDAPLPVSADPERLEQVLRNLVSNAVKYSQAGTSIDVDVTRTDGEARISVRDAGIGIAPEALPHIFSRFFRGGTGSQPIQGFGIGLYVVKEIISRHQGSIEVESQPQRGSTFTIRLPILPA